MDHNIAEGKFDQLKGKVKQTVGEAIGNDKLANSGTADQVKGNLKEAWGHTKDAVHAIADDARAQTAVKREAAKEQSSQTAHNVRETIASGAQRAKDGIAAKAEEVKFEHKRTA